MVREQSEAVASKHDDVQIQKLQSIVDSYDSMFKVPRDGANLPDVPECISILTDSKPVNRPAFRQSLKERHEVETQVVDTLQKGWMEPSGSA
jgi:hypothetical protein